MKDPIVNEWFEWDKPRDKNAFASLRSIIKHRHGAWKSTAQALFFQGNGHVHLSAKEKPEEYVHEEVEENLGVQLIDGQDVAFMSGVYSDEYSPGDSWSESNFRRVMHVFVFDSLGVVEHLRMPFTKSKKPNPARISRVWVRERSPDKIINVWDSESARASRHYQDATKMAPSGETLVRGEIVSAKVVDGLFGKSPKIMVVDDRGFKVWMTRPGSIGAAPKGSRIELVARLEPSDSDPCFAIGKYPKKAAVIGKNMELEV
jgi:hypothetical protein